MLRYSPTRPHLPNRFRCLRPFDLMLHCNRLNCINRDQSMLSSSHNNRSLRHNSMCSKITRPLVLLHTSRDTTQDITHKLLRLCNDQYPHSPLSPLLSDDTHRYLKYRSSHHRHLRLSNLISITLQVSTMPHMVVLLVSQV